MKLKYIMRQPSDAFVRALSNHPLGHLIDVDEALRQHANVVEVMRAAGADIVMLPPEPDLADAPFVQDTMISFSSPAAGAGGGPSVLLVATRPGAPSRQPEVPSVLACAHTLVSPACRILTIEEPGTMDGGDILVWGDRVAIGVSGRTNEHGARQLQAAVEDIGYRAWLCPVSDTRLHFASAVTVVNPTRLIGTAVGFADLDAVSRELLESIDRVLIPDAELPGHNVLNINGTIVIPAGNPVAVAMLRERGETVVEVPYDQFTRADAGLTCLVGAVH
jgi:dimethylargininase